MNPAAYSHLAQLLAKRTKMTVMVAINEMPILANHVYVIPSNADLVLKENTLKVISPRTVRSKQIDIFFISLAEAMRNRAIGVVLSGYDSDGTEGCKHIKEKGGITFAQDNSAEIESMPRSAQASGYIDFVLSPAKIAGKLQKLALLQK